MKFEYKSVWSNSENQPESFLNSLGYDGWELIAIDAIVGGGSTYIFKRVLEPVGDIIPSP